MRASMFKRLRFAFLLLPILSVGALAGCTAQVGTGAPGDETNGQSAQLTTPTVAEGVVVDGTQVVAPIPALNVDQHRTKPQLPLSNPVDPGQVEDGTPRDPDPSPWVEGPGGSDPDPSPWMHQASSSQSTK